MVEQLEVLQVEYVGQLDSLEPVVHNSEEHVGLIVRSHDQLQVFGRNFLDLLIRREETESLDVFDEQPELFKSILEVCLSAVDVVVVSDAFLLELVELVKHLFLRIAVVKRVRFH